MQCFSVDLDPTNGMQCSSVTLEVAAAQLTSRLYLMFEHNYYTGYGVTGDVNRSGSCQNRTGV